MNTNLNKFNNRTGLHFYINIKNFDNLVSTDETDGDMSHLFHLLNTFLTTIERYIRDNFNTEYVLIEKLTGSRLHIIIYKECKDALSYFLNISKFAFLLSKFIIALPKYKTFSKVSLQIGADFGHFHDFVFQDITNKFEEYVSIGHPANFACKLQGLANPGEILISKRIYDAIDPVAGAIITKIDSSRQMDIFNKYPDSGNIAYSIIDTRRDLFYESLNKKMLFESIDNKKPDSNSYLELARRIAEKTNYNDMEFVEPRKLLFENWNIKRSARFNAAIVFADVRGFTKKFDPNGANLARMSEITREVLDTMYCNCDDTDGVHIQFQGDREFVFFEEDNIQKSITFALKLNKEISKITDINVGIGINFGKVYATQIGLESEDDSFVKQNIMIGKTVKEADKLEDQCAKAGEIVISNSVYNHRLLNNAIKKLFQKRDYYWVTMSNFDDYYRTIREIEYKNSSVQNTYKPWNEN